MNTKTSEFTKAITKNLYDTILDTPFAEDPNLRGIDVRRRARDMAAKFASGMAAQFTEALEAQFSGADMGSKWTRSHMTEFTYKMIAKFTDDIKKAFTAAMGKDIRNPIEVFTDRINEILPKIKETWEKNFKDITENTNTAFNSMSSASEKWASKTDQDFKKAEASADGFANKMWSVSDSILAAFSDMKRAYSDIFSGGPNYGEIPVNTGDSTGVFDQSPLSQPAAPVNNINVNVTNALDLDAVSRATLETPQGQERVNNAVLRQIYAGGPMRNAIKVTAGG